MADAIRSVRGDVHASEPILLTFSSPDRVGSHLYPCAALKKELNSQNSDENLATMVKRSSVSQWAQASKR